MNSMNLLEANHIVLFKKKERKSFNHYILNGYSFNYIVFLKYVITRNSVF